MNSLDKFQASENRKKNTVKESDEAEMYVEAHEAMMKVAMVIQKVDSRMLPKRTQAMFKQVRIGVSEILVMIKEDIRMCVRG